MDSCKNFVVYPVVLMLTGLLLFPVQSLAQSPADTALSTTGKGHLQFPSAPFSQPNRSFLNRNAWQGYLNYGKEAYETYTVSSRSFELYDRLGYRILRGYPLLTWQETRSKDPALQTSDVFRSQQYWQWFYSLTVLQESYSGWDLGLMIGDNIRTTLTPMTFSTPRFDGVRLDGQSTSRGFTLLLTRGQDRRFSTFQSQDETNPVLQYGGRWYSKIGGIVTAGITFFNQHEADLFSGRGNFLHGTIPSGTERPTKIFVRVQDDSPDDKTPSRVYSMDIFLNVLKNDGKRVTLTSRSGVGPGTEYTPSLRPAVATGRRVGDHYEAQGENEVVDFEFTIPSVKAIYDTRFDARVSGDYRIGVRQTHQFWNTKARTPQWEERRWPASPIPRLHNMDGRPEYPVDFKPAETAAFYTLVRADGNPTGTTPRVLSFSYGIPVGQTLAGADVEVRAHEVTARGELVYNWQEHQFPFNNDSLDIAGNRFGSNALAGYLTVVRTFGPRLRRAEVGAEVFRVDPDYSGGYDSRRGGVIFFTDRDGDFETVAGQRVYSGFTQEFDLVADNDDNDDWSDDTPPEEGRFQPLQPQVYSGVKAHSGVFPGLDDDGDNAPDTDRNRNGIADWTEPFLLYRSDPPDFAYGIDFNNNGVPDFRENDSEPDYPYRRDSKGYHGFIIVPRPFPLTDRLTFGYYSIRQTAGGGTSKGPYARLQHRSSPWGSLEVRFDDDVKYVHDTIRDDVYVFDVTPNGLNSGSVLTPPPPDPLTMKKSLVNTAFLNVKATPLRSLNFGVQLLHFTNRQGDLTMTDGTHQEADLLTRITTVGRVEYSVRWGKFDVWTGAKALLREGNRRSLSKPESSVRFFAPVVRVAYAFLPDVSVQWGVSGFNWLPMRYTDGVNETSSYKQHTTVVMVSSHTDDYLGYAVSINLGVQWQKVDFDRGDRSRDSDTFGFFVESFTGF